jgi:hypothetical protein
MTRPAAAGLLIGAMVALLVGIPAEASAKGAKVVRGYAVVTGPGLAHPIVFSAPWDRSMGGYYSLEAEDFVNFATFAGGIPGYVRPSPRAPAPAPLGPGYEVIFFRDCCRLAVHQVVYPFAQGGPWVYVPPGQRPAMRRVFGRFWGGGAASGWAQAHLGLVVLLEQRGLPDEQPSPPGRAQTAPAQGSSLRGMLALFAGLLAIAVALTVLRKRRT